MKKVILASQSPRRKELMGEIVTDFEIIPSNVDENVPEDVKIEQIPQFLSHLKATDVSRKYPDAIVIGSDTIVVVDDKVLNKPKDEKDAFLMLSMLSGRRHKVCTGCTFIYKDKELAFTEKTEVEFFELTKQEIEEYIKTGDCMDKAGAYGIQSQGKTLVKAIYGDYYNVVGLPVGRVKRELEKFINTLE